MLILGIETSCDETSTSLIGDGNKLLSNVVVSQDEIHSPHGGIVPEMASRQHILKMNHVVEQALEEAEATFTDIDLIAVTNGPGLAGSLIVGVNYAKGLSVSLSKPLIGVNHLKAHVYACWIREDVKTGVTFDIPEEFPIICIIVSGGHTDLVKLEKDRTFKLIGRTRDDAAGEAFDKAARLLGLGFPGGPQVERMARFSHDSYDFPRAYMEGSDDFSFSGMKTAFLHLTKKFDSLSKNEISKLCYTFQEAIVDVVITKTLKVAGRENCKGIILTGGVASNSVLREQMLKRSDIPVFIPAKTLCTDNGAMVASYAYENIKLGKNITRSSNLDIFPSLGW